MKRWITRLVLACAAALALTAVAAPGDLPDAVFDIANQRVQEVIRIQDAVTADLMALDGILGTAVGQDDNGQLALVVYVNTENANRGEIMRALPRAIRGVRVAGHLTDPFVALAGKGPPSGGGDSGGSTTVDHKAKQNGAIQLGTSGGWAHDLANGYCCGGTLGSLVQIGNVQYILSNYHVLEADIFPGKDGLVAVTGQPVIQPGLIDVGCNANNAQNVATLVVSKSLPNSNVDAAIAEVVSGMVNADGAILGIGTISKTTVAASVRQGVKKSGRTTGLTRSTVSGLNATVSVSYSNECAGGTAFTKTFTGQIVVNNKGSKFLAGGDSGSLMVEDVTTNPRAVGLLFAGSSTSGIANPIKHVLDFFNATMVGVVEE